MAEEKARRLSINQSMTKPLLILGCDRSLFMASALFCGYVGFNIGLMRGKISIVFLAAALWGVIYFGLRLLGKADPMMLEVFRRSSHYSDGPFHTQFFMPAHSSVEDEPPAFMQKRWL
ncbi:MAG: VirB3 family type IV secretion system protein [Synergistaceae bacterium]|jgi:type IV secretory pathway TrbD component|nr:VirB3 family type IV secretion system protein [Synergistaceae bacterium]